MTDTQTPTDVDAEIVDTPSPLEARIAADLATFSPADAAIAELATRYRGLSIDGIEDKEGEKAVRAAVRDVKSHRTAVEARRKELKADALKYGRAVDAEAKRITAAILEVEEPLAEELAAVKAERDRIAAEEEAEHEARMNARLDALQATGVTIAVASVMSWSDEEFAEALQEATAMRDAREAKAAEEAAAAKAEADRVAAERAKIDEERAALEAERAELQRAKDEAEAEMRVREEAAAKLEREKAEEELRAKREAVQAKRRENLRPDADKVRGVAAAIKAIEPPLFSLAIDYGKDVYRILNDAEAALNALADSLDGGAA